MDEVTLYIFSTWDGRDFQSQVVHEDEAAVRRAYDHHKRVMPNCPARLQRMVNTTLASHG